MLVQPRGDATTSARAAPQDRFPRRHRRPHRLQPQPYPVPPPLSPTVRKSIADARAELIPSQMRIEQDPVTAEPRASAAAAAASFQNNQRAAAPELRRHRPSRRAGRILRTRAPAGNPPPGCSRTGSKPAKRCRARAAATVTPVALAAANSSLEKQSASMQMLFLVMAGALALAGITASLISAVRRAATQPEIRGDRRAIWDRIHTERSSPSMFPDEDTPIWHANAPRDVSTRPARARRSGAAGDGNAGAAGAQRADVTDNASGDYFSSWRCKPRTNSERPICRSRLSRSACRIDCTLRRLFQCCD